MLNTAGLLQHSAFIPIRPLSARLSRVDLHRYHSSFISRWWRRWAPRDPTAQTLIEKIVQRHLLPDKANRPVRSSDIVRIVPAHLMTHDNTWAVMSKFSNLGDELRIADPGQPVIALDHNVQDRSERNLARYRAIETFAKQQRIDFWPAGRGIGHQVMCEEGYVNPGRMVVASDSHSNMYGALGALGTPMVRTDAAGIWATGSTWWRVPPVTQVSFKGRTKPGVTGKDVILALCGMFSRDEVLNHAVEFTGEGVRTLSVEERMTIANMTTEWGAVAGVFPADEVLLEWLTYRAKVLRRKWGALQRVKECEKVVEELNEKGGLQSDDRAHYVKELEVDLRQLVPMVAGPNEVKRVRAVNEVEAEKVRVDKAYLVSCVNSRASDLVEAAKVLEGKQIHNGVQMYIAAASSEVEKEVRLSGHWRTLVKAGARELPSGCGPCVGLGKGLLKSGEVAISATNRNFRGRMGSREAQAYLASPAIVAWSAVRGYIAGPEWVDQGGWITGRILYEAKREVHLGHRRATKIIPGFPANLSGEVLLCPAPNIDTDGIYAGMHLYQDLNSTQQAKVVMENYDPNFAQLVRDGDVLVTGPNFGCGSSREQAATALRACGVQVIVTASVNETFRRNALNNGLIVVESPDLYRRLVGIGPDAGKEGGTIRTGAMISLDFQRSVIRAEWDGGEFACGPMSPVAQEIIVAGGLEEWIRNSR